MTFSIAPLDRIYKYLSAYYGAQSGTNFRNVVAEARNEHGGLTPEGKSKVKDMFKQILVKEIVKSYRIPNAVSLHNLI